MNGSRVVTVVLLLSIKKQNFDLLFPRRDLCRHEQHLAVNGPYNRPYWKQP